jgi:hypothetical protein
MLQTKHFPIGYTGTKAEIEAVTPVATNSRAVTTDTDESGYYDGTAWVWDRTVYTDTKDPTGWLSPTNVTVSYNATNRTVTLTPVSGTLQYYWRGVKVDLGATWTSAAHTNADGEYYLYSTDGVNIGWSNTVWAFDMLMVAKAIVSTTPAYKFAIKETHGLMPWEVHQELHETVSSYRTSGGALTAGTYAENTATDAANSPGFDAAIIKDEDDSVTIPAWVEGTYTTMRIGASSKATFDTTATLPFRSSGSYILVNNPTTGAETASTNNKYVNVYQVLIPAAADTDSQKYRTVMLQPQRDHPSLADAQLENPQNLSFGDLSATTPEFVIYARITYALSAGDGNTGKARIATGGITYITGSRLAQTSISGLSNHEDLSGLLGGAVDEHYHLTSTEYTGTGTGVLVRATSPTIVTPTIASLVNANHTHAASGATGGVISSLLSHYKTGAEQAIPSGAWTLIDFGTLVADGSSCVTTGASWAFTAPTAGKYLVSAFIMYEAYGGWLETEEAYLAIYKNGSAFVYVDHVDGYQSASSISMRVGGSFILELGASDYISIYAYQSSGKASPDLKLQPNALLNQVAIVRLGA